MAGDRMIVSKGHLTCATLLAEEARQGHREEGLAAAHAYLESLPHEKGMDYDEFVLSL